MIFRFTTRPDGRTLVYPATDVLGGRTIAPVDCVPWERELVGALGALALYFFIARFCDCEVA